MAGLASISNTVARSFASSGPCGEKPLFKGLAGIGRHFECRMCAPGADTNRADLLADVDHLACCLSLSEQVRQGPGVRPMCWVLHRCERPDVGCIPTSSAPHDKALATSRAESPTNQRATRKRLLEPQIGMALAPSRSIPFQPRARRTRPTGERYGFHHSKRPLAEPGARP